MSLLLQAIEASSIQFPQALGNAGVSFMSRLCEPKIMTDTFPKQLRPEIPRTRKIWTGHEISHII